MKRFDWKYIPIFVLLALSLALTPVFRAQDQSVTRIIPVPDGVDPRIPKLTLAAPPQGDSSAVAEAARLLVAAENPKVAEAVAMAEATKAEAVTVVEEKKKAA